MLSAVHEWGVLRSAVYARGRWATPLGEIEVDEHLAVAVLETGSDLVVDAPEMHAGEHSAEVQVPFIQYLFPEARIVPVLIPPGETAVLVGEVIGQVVSAVQRPVAVVGTTDLTHYGQRYGFAPAGTGERALEWVRANDRRVIDLILAMRAEEIAPETAGHYNACGGGAVAATIAAARVLGARKGHLLEYTTSHHAMPRDRPPTLWATPPSSLDRRLPMPLSPEDREYLLSLARKIIACHLRGEDPPGTDLSGLTESLARDGASFVTLTEYGELRGCIGSLEPRRPLVLDVRENAVAAAFHDPRFPPLRPQELDDLHIEIRLDPPSAALVRRSRRSRRQTAARRGRRGHRARLEPGHLPQVWEKLPDPHQFLQHLCLKAGLPADAYRRPGLDVYTYQVEEFEEQK